MQCWNDEPDDPFISVGLKNACISYIKDIDRLVAGWLPCSPGG